MIPPELLEILRCPRTGQKLALANAEVLECIKARETTGLRTEDHLRVEEEPVMHERVVAALVTEDRRWLYPVIDDIPVLLVDEAIALS